MTHVHTNLMNALHHAKHDLALTAEVLRMMLSAQEAHRPELLKTFLVGLDEIDSDESMQVQPWIDNETGWNLRCEYGSQMDRQILCLIRKNLPEAAFYSRLWQFIHNYVEQESFDVGVVALFRCSCCNLLPYVYLPTEKMMSMSQEEFSKITGSLYNSGIHEIHCILEGKLEQRTQRASLLLDLLDRYAGKERVVLMSALLQTASRKPLHPAALAAMLDVLGKSDDD